MLLAVSFQLSAQPSFRARQAQAAACTLTFLRAHQWVTESQANNAGPGVEQLVRAGGGDYRAKPEWCGFTQAAANRSCGLPIPRGGMQGAARAWFPLAGPDAWRTTFHRAAGRGSIDSIHVGQKAGFDYGKGVHHVAEVGELGRPVRAGRAPRSLYTYAGNEGQSRTAGRLLLVREVRIVALRGQHRNDSLALVSASGEIRRRREERAHAYALLSRQELLTDKVLSRPLQKPMLLDPNFWKGLGLGEVARLGMGAYFK